MFLQYQPKTVEWIRRFSPHFSSNAFYGLDGTLQTSFIHMHPFEIQPAYGGRFGWFVDRNQDRPTRPFIVYRPRRPAGRDSAGPVHVVAERPRVPAQPERARDRRSFRYRLGHYYDGDFNSIEIASDYRFSAQLTASLGWTRQDASLPSGSFVTNLVPIKVIYSFTPLASVSALLQHNGQTGQFSSNVRLAILNRSGTGLFVVYNDRRDFTDYTSLETLGTIVRREIHEVD